MKLHVTLLDTLRTAVALKHESQQIPYGRRLVQIQLTPEQCALLEPRHTGRLSGEEYYEEYELVWLER